LVIDALNHGNFNESEYMEPHPAKADLVFVHLSDIHFRKGRAGDAHDEDSMVRNEIEIDLRRLRTRLPRLDGLIVSGDIAYGGKAEEYEYATGWIGSICEQLNCAKESVMVTPGNHDIDRALIPELGDVDRLHQAIRGEPSLERQDAALADILRDASRGQLLLSPLFAYNAFAKEYGCNVSCAQPYWERDFRLSDGTTLRFRGAATTMLSSSRDHQDTHRMLYGGAQRTILRRQNVRHVLIAHHPPSWTMEGDTADQVFSTLTVLQVFGHKHEQWLTSIGNSVRLIAGAVHPSRWESNWLPRYAAITISVVDERNLALRIYPRRWSTEEFMFIGDFNSHGQDYRDHTVAVDCRQDVGS
jgi:calcineurin-like phosphoesterase family protein